VTLVEWIVVLLVPIAILGARWLWNLHREVVANDGRAARPTIRLSLVLTIVGVAAAAIGSYFGFVVVLRHVGFADVAEHLAPVTIAAILALEMAPFCIAVYLRWARTQVDPPE
jgi:hypothetical protein